MVQIRLPTDSKICKKKVTQGPSLQKHMRVHTGDRPYKCDFEGCDKAFTQVINRCVEAGRVLT